MTTKKPRTALYSFDLTVTDNGLYVVSASYDGEDDADVLALTPEEFNKWLLENLPYLPEAVEQPKGLLVPIHKSVQIK